MHLQSFEDTDIAGERAVIDVIRLLGLAPDKAVEGRALLIRIVSMLSMMVR